MKRATPAILAAALLAGGCARIPMTRFDHGDIHLQVGGRIKPVDKVVAALPPPPGTFYMMLDKQAMQVTIEARLVEISNRDLRLLGVDLWPAGQELRRPTTVKDTTARLPKMSVGFGLSSGGGGRDRHQGQRDRRDRSVGTGVGLGFPIGDDDGGVTAARATFDGVELGILPRTYVVITIELGRHLNGQIMIRPLLLPIEVVPKPEPGQSPAPRKTVPPTHVTVLPDNTITLGGLVTDEAEVKREVPALGDIPLLNRLFRHKDRARDTRDLLIFVTPRIILNEE